MNKFIIKTNYKIRIPWKHEFIPFYFADDKVYIPTGFLFDVEGLHWHDFKYLARYKFINSTDTFACVDDVINQIQSNPQSVYEHEDFWRNKAFDCKDNIISDFRHAKNFCHEQTGFNLPEDWGKFDADKFILVDLSNRPKRHLLALMKYLPQLAATELQQYEAKYIREAIVGVIKKRNSCLKKSATIVYSELAADYLGNVLAPDNRVINFYQDSLGDKFIPEIDLAVAVGESDYSATQTDEFYMAIVLADCARYSIPVRGKEEPIICIKACHVKNILQQFAFVTILQSRADAANRLLEFFAHHVNIPSIVKNPDKDFCREFFNADLPAEWDSVNFDAIADDLINCASWYLKALAKALGNLAANDTQKTTAAKIQSQCNKIIRERLERCNKPTTVLTFQNKQVVFATFTAPNGTQIEFSDGNFKGCYVPLRQIAYALVETSGDFFDTVVDLRHAITAVGSYYYLYHTAGSYLCFHSGDYEIYLDTADLCNILTEFAINYTCDRVLANNALKLCKWLKPLMTVSLSNL